MLCFGLVPRRSNLLIRVLVVDPEKTVADGAAMLLRSRGFKARSAYSAEEAVAEATDLQPHALICDVVLPGMDGVGLAGWFAENLPACKVILISFNASTVRRAEEGVRAGHVHAFLRKREELGQVLTILSEIEAEKADSQRE